MPKVKNPDFSRYGGSLPRLLKRMMNVQKSLNRMVLRRIGRDKYTLLRQMNGGARLPIEECKEILGIP